MTRNDLGFKAAVFDFGGVLCQPAAEEMDQFAALAGLTRAEFVALYATTRGPCDRGVMSPAEYWPYVATLVGTSYSPPQIERLTAMDLHIFRGVDSSLLGLVSELRRAGLRTGILSNMQPDLLRILRAQADWLDLFDVHVFSCDVHLVKPEPEIYRHLLRQLEALPEEVIFVDDMPRNVEAARDLGIHALLYRSVAQLRDELRCIG
jgi:putative hydrolase of the HAD superfamily